MLYESATTNKRTPGWSPEDHAAYLAAVGEFANKPIGVGETVGKISKPVTETVAAIITEHRQPGSGLSSMEARIKNNILAAKLKASGVETDPKRHARVERGRTNINAANAKRRARKLENGRLWAARQADGESIGKIASSSGTSRRTVSYAIAAYRNSIQQEKANG